MRTLIAGIMIINQITLEPLSVRIRIDTFILNFKTSLSFIKDLSWIDELFVIDYCNIDLFSCLH